MPALSARGSIVLALLPLAGCFPFDDRPPDASEAQVLASARGCGVSPILMEPQDPDNPKRWVLSLTGSPTERKRMRDCLLKAQLQIGADFTIFG